LRLLDCAVGRIGVGARQVDRDRVERGEALTVTSATNRRYCTPCCAAIVVQAAAVTATCDHHAMPGLLLLWLLERGGVPER